MRCLVAFEAFLSMVLGNCLGAGLMGYGILSIIATLLIWFKCLSVSFMIWSVLFLPGLAMPAGLTLVFILALFGSFAEILGSALKIACR